MVRSAIRRLPLLSFALLIAAVGIAPRRGGSDSREDTSSPRPGSSIPSGISGFSPSATGPVGIQRRESIENEPRRHYWHDHRGRRYSHFYDGVWWGYDDSFSRWVYWNDGFGWWPGTGGAQFVYAHDGYYPYSAVRQAAVSAPPSSPDANGAWTSPDALRLVEISGPDAKAHLFDATTNPASYIAFLGKEIQKVRFSAAAPGYPPTVAVEFRNGAAAVFDYDGRRLDSAKPAPVKTPPP